MNSKDILNLKIFADNVLSGLPRLHDYWDFYVEDSFFKAKMSIQNKPLVVKGDLYNGNIKSLIMFGIEFYIYENDNIQAKFDKELKAHLQAEQNKYFNSAYK